MKFIIALVTLNIGLFGYSQKLNNVATIKIVEFKDTIHFERDAYIKFKLTNTSDSPIIIRDYRNIYFKLICLDKKCFNRKKNKVINTYKDSKIIATALGRPVQQTLMPQESIDLIFSYNLYGWGTMEVERIKIKLLYDLIELNKNCRDPESEWIYQYQPRL